MGKKIWRTAFRTGLWLLAGLGGITLWDAATPQYQDCPQVYQGTTNSRQNTTLAIGQSSSLDSVAAWESLSPTTEILKQVRPPVAIWLQEQHQLGLIEYVDQPSGFYAKFDLINRKLTLNRSFFEKSDWIKATFISHEFRHAQQSFPQFTRCVLSHLMGPGDESILENDAYLYELQTLMALRGEIPPCLCD